MNTAPQPYRNYVDIDSINRRLRTDPKGFVEACESAYFAKLDAAADFIAARADTVGVLLLAGPSSSGKTTSSHRLSTRLAKLGIRTQTVSMDDYFMTIDQSDPTIDYEAPERLDIELLRQHIHILAEGGEVRLPHFDFQTGLAGMSDQVISREKGTVVIFEGLHALSELFNTAGKAVRIYVSPCMRVTQDNRVYLTAEALRFMRRCARDIRFRGASFERTLRLWPNVIRGERRFVIPSKTNADIVIDTSLAYEPGLIAPAVAEGLHTLDAKALADIGLEGIAERAEEFACLDSSLIPEDSLMREFIGNEGL